MVDAVVTVCLEKVFNILEAKGRVVTEYNKQLKGLQNELKYIQIFLKDADRRKRTDEVMRQFVSDLRELVYEAEDILMDCEVKDGNDDEDSKNEQRPSSTSWLSRFNPARVPLRYNKSNRLKEINEEISSIKTKVESYFKLRAPSNVGRDDGTDRWSSTVYDHSQVVGLEGDKIKIKEWLFKSEESELLLVMAFVGMGGLGKTTIAQEVFNDKEIENCFERRIWVTVTQNFTEEQIMRSILRSLGDASVGDDPGTLLKKIQQYLTGKRYLIVMDDVWDKNLSWWDKICQGLPRGQGGSVIVTTRSESVARKVQAGDKTHRPELLSDDNSWLLFCKVAFAANCGVCEPPELEDVGKEIVTKCKGLPLMIKAVGGLLLCKDHDYHEWRRIEESLQDELRENKSITEDVMSSLQLSYDELPSHLKSCFLTLSLYPEDCVIPKQQLVHGWIGEGFVMLRNGRSSTVSGEDCFSGLTNRCLVEVVDKTYSGTIVTCKIHDMIRDLVIEIAENDCFSNPKGLNCRHLGVSGNKKIRVNPKLRGLVSTTKTGEVNEVNSNLAKKFTECKYLRVLDISKSIFDAPLSDILDEIASLKHLACLSLRNTHPLIQLPRSMEELQNLQILDASYCHNLKQLQPCIVLFKKLLVLDMTNCGSLEYFPKGIGSLGNLEVLLGFKPSMSSNGSKLSEVRSLTNLRKLGLSLTCGDQIEEDELDCLVNLSKLMLISINCFDSYYGDDDLINKIDALTPPRQLHELSLEFYPGKSSPSWLSPITLPMLRYMSICSGSLAKMHQNFWKTTETNTHWRIEALMFHSLSELDIDWEELQRSMPYLRTVHANWCPELESFPIEDVSFRGGVWTKTPPPPHRT